MEALEQKFCLLTPTELKFVPEKSSSWKNPCLEWFGHPSWWLSSLGDDSNERSPANEARRSSAVRATTWRTIARCWLTLLCVRSLVRHGATEPLAGKEAGHRALSALVQLCRFSEERYHRQDRIDQWYSDQVRGAFTRYRGRSPHCYHSFSASILWPGGERMVTRMMHGWRSSTRVLLEDFDGLKRVPSRENSPRDKEWKIEVEA